MNFHAKEYAAIMFYLIAFKRLTRLGAARRAFFAIALLLLLSGCVHGGKPFEPATPVIGRPDIADILEDLAANDAAITQFTASGPVCQPAQRAARSSGFTLRSPVQSARRDPAVENS